MEEIKKDVENLIQNLMVKKGIDKYDLFFDGKSEAGDNYAGEILFLQVVPKDGKKKLHLVAKAAKRSKDLNKFLPIYMVYEREVLMYSQVFPTYRILIEETHSGLNFDFVPKVYFISDIKSKETIIFENLKARGFRLHDRTKPWNLEHSLLAMKSYGELHALSIAFRLQKPAEYHRITNQMPNIAKTFNQTMDTRTQSRTVVNHAMYLLRINGREDLVKKYDNLMEEMGTILNHDVEIESDKIVIGHSDCWNNNFMFQYQDEDECKPSSISLLDFQLCQPSSPVKDLSHNIYTTCDKTTLEHFDKLLETYHNSLSVCLIKLGCEADVLITLDQLKDHWRKYGKFGLLVALFVLKICLMEKDEIPDFSDISKESENMEEFTEALNFTVKKPEEYNRRVLDIFVHFGENFL